MLSTLLAYLVARHARGERLPVPYSVITSWELGSLVTTRLHPSTKRQDKTGGYWLGEETGLGLRDLRNTRYFALFSHISGIYGEPYILLFFGIQLRDLARMSDQDSHGLDAKSICPSISRLGSQNTHPPVFSKLGFKPSAIIDTGLRVGTLVGTKVPSPPPPQPTIRTHHSALALYLLTPQSSPPHCDVYTHVRFFNPTTRTAYHNKKTRLVFISTYSCTLCPQPLPSLAVMRLRPGNLGKRVACLAQRTSPTTRSSHTSSSSTSGSHPDSESGTSCIKNTTSGLRAMDSPSGRRRV